MDWAGLAELDWPELGFASLTWAKLVGWTGLEWTELGWAEVGGWTVPRQRSEMAVQQASSRLLLPRVWVTCGCAGGGNVEFWGTISRSGLSPLTPLEEGKASWPRRAAAS